MSKTNEQKVKEYQKNKWKKVIFILLYIAVIVLEMLALFRIIDMMWGILVFIPVYLFKKNI